MKKLEFETSKGRFVLVDLPIDVTSIKYSEKGIWIKYEGDKEWNPFLDNEGGVFLINTLKQMTEDQAINILSIEDIIKDPLPKDSIDHVKSLHLLLKSKGIYLFRNPNNSEYFTNRSTEQKTFYNPYIFKLCN